MRIAVAGGGIAGLASAIALAARGFDVDLYERAPELRETGAGIQLSPNATSLLERLGVFEQIAGYLFEPEALVVRDAWSANVLARLPLGPSARARYGAPYCTLSRAHLQASLIAAARRSPAIAFHLNAEVERVHATKTGAAFSAGGTEQRADLLVAADGVHSAIRTDYFKYDGPRPLDHSVWRATLEAADVPDGVSGEDVSLWLGAGSHLVHYAVASKLAPGKSVNVVLIGKTGVEPPIARYGPAARRLIDAVPEWRRSQLFDLDGGRPWASEAVVLVGDAAHAMAPSAAQGGAQAIEDAWVLAAVLAKTPARTNEALWHFQRLRQPRVGRIARLASRSLRIYEAEGFSAHLRNALLKALPARLALSNLHWLFGWTAE